MGQYLSIESRDPIDSGDSQNFYDLAAGLAKKGNKSVSPRRAPARRAGRRAHQAQGGDEQ
jgi:hypothetical protein